MEELVAQPRGGGFALEDYAAELEHGDAIGEAQAEIEVASGANGSHSGRLISTRPE